MNFSIRSLACVLLVSLAAAQQAKLESSPGGALIPKVTFTRNWPEAAAQFFSIETESSGRAEYRSQSPQGSEQPYILKFTMPEPERNRIFRLAQQANDFRGNLELDDHKVAQTGIKTLAYKDATHNAQITYNSSSNKYIEELTSIFIDLSTTIESGRRLDYLMQHDKLGLYQQLNSMVESAKLGDLEGVQIIAPVLQQIARDPQYMNIARNKAKELLHLENR
jgi:hypothetical protein